LALWAGLGLHIAVERLPVMWRRPAAASAVAVTVLAVAMVHWARNDRSGEWLGRDRAAAMLAELAPDAVLLLRADLDTPTTAYLHLIERRRPDVTLVSEQALVLEPRLFDPYRTPKAAQRQVIDAYVQHVGRPVYRTFNGDPRPGTVSWLLFRLDTSSGPGAGERHFRFPAVERALLRRIVEHGPFQNGWNEFLRRYLLESFARFQTMAELAGEWPGTGDSALAQMVDTVLVLPEAALMRASVLSNADALGHADEIHALLERFAAQVNDPWVTKQHLALYYNTIARGAQFSGHDQLARIAVKRSLEYWPEAANPATKAEAAYRKQERQKAQ
jgi:hypothetical protein